MGASSKNWLSRIRVFRLFRDRALVKLTASLLGATSRIFGDGGLERPTLLVIDAGEVGWTLIEYQELLASASEYLGAGGVRKVTIRDRDRYWRQMRRVVSEQPITHYLFDPRSLSDSAMRSWFQTISIAISLAIRGITPIARLTDVQVRRWRLQTALVTARAGTCTIFMNPARARSVCAHRSLVGPMPMALSRSTLDSLIQLPGPTPDAHESVVFTGSLYEPRTTFLTDLENLLAQHGITLKIRSRASGATRTPNDQYWGDLASSGIVVSTTHMSVMRGQDDLRETQFVYRFVEALAVGRPLVSTAVDGTEHLLEPGRHFLLGIDPDSACRQILVLLGDSALREKIASEGRSRVRELVDENYFWREVDRTLDWALTRPHLAERPPSTTRR